MNNNLRKITLLVITLVTLTSCTKEEDVAIAPFTPAIFKESLVLIISTLMLTLIFQVG